MTLQKKIMLPILVLAVVVVSFVFMVTRQQAIAPTVTEDGTGDSIEQIDSDLNELEENLDQMDADMDDIEQDIDALEEEMENQ